MIYRDTAAYTLYTMIRKKQLVLSETFIELRCSLLDLNVYDTHDGIGIFGDLQGSVETLTSWGE